MKTETIKSIVKKYAHDYRDMAMNEENLEKMLKEMARDIILVMPDYDRNNLEIKKELIDHLQFSLEHPFV